MKLAALTALFLLLTSLGAVAEMYKYTDENGQVVYTQFRPQPGVETETIKGPTPPPSTATDSQRKLLDNLQKQVDDREDKKQAEQESKEQEQEQTDKDRMARNCEVAQKNLKILQNRGNRKLLDKDGNVLDLSDEKQLQKRIQRAQEVIQRDCK